MNTDWNLIRNLLSVTVDALESVDRHGPLEAKRALETDVNGKSVKIFDILQSAWLDLSRKSMIRCYSSSTRIE